MKAIAYAVPKTYHPILRIAHRGTWHRCRVCRMSDYSLTASLAYKRSFRWSLFGRSFHFRFSYVCRQPGRRRGWCGYVRRSFRVYIRYTLFLPVFHFRNNGDSWTSRLLSSLLPKEFPIWRLTSCSVCYVFWKHARCWLLPEYSSCRWLRSAFRLYRPAR